MTNAIQQHLNDVNGRSAHLCVEAEVISETAYEKPVRLVSRQVVYRYEIYSIVLTLSPSLSSSPTSVSCALS